MTQSPLQTIGIINLGVLLGYMIGQLFTHKYDQNSQDTTQQKLLTQ